MVQNWYLHLHVCIFTSSTSPSSTNACTAKLQWSMHVVSTVTFFFFFHVQCCWPFQLSAGRFVKLCDKMTPKSSAVNCLFGPMVSNESVWISSAGVSLFGCRSGEQCQSLSLANGVQCMVWWWRVSESVFGQWCAVHGLMVKSVRVCLWPMACNERSDGEECQNLSLANGVQWMVWWWRVSVCPFGQWCAVHGLMVKSVSLSLWPMAYNERSDGEECQSVPLANGVQCMVWWWRVSESVFSQWRAMNGLMVKSVRICLWPMVCNEWSDGEDCQSVPLANGLQWMVWWWTLSESVFGQWHAMNGLMVKSVSLSLANGLQ